MAQTFNMYPDVSATALATALGFSIECLSALNTTVACDPDLFRMAGQVDMYYWSSDNVSSLCTDDCIWSSSEWIDGIYGSCNPTDTIAIDKKLVPADSIAIRYSDGIGLVCLTDLDIAVQSYDIPPSSTSTGSPTSSSTSTLPSQTPTDIPSPNVTVTLNNSTGNFSYCWLESQNWVGQDPDPDCAADPTNVFCTNPDSQTRIANLYNDTILCSNCFLSVMWWRINSPFLPDSDYSDYLIEQYQDIKDVCNVTMPDSLIRALPSYAAAPSPTILPPGTDPNENGTLPGSCNGQMITSSTTKREYSPAHEAHERPILPRDFSGKARVKRATSGACDALSTKYGVPTGGLQAATGADDCSITSSPVCVPLSCQVSQVVDGQTCASIASSLSVGEMNVTVSLFLQWNPNIIGLCDSLIQGQYICTGPPGGGYTLPPPLNGTDTTASDQNRGGQGPQGVTPTANSTLSAPSQPGIASNCNAFAYATAGDTCFDMSQRFGITLAQLTTWNPVLGYPDGHNCTTQFWAGYDYCVGVPGSGSTTTTTSKTSTTSGLPYPTQSGIDPNCNSYAEAVAGDYCFKFASDHNITTDELYAWNKILGVNGADCSTQFQAGYDYCIGVATTSTTTTTPTTTTAPPVPTQTGLAANCNKIVVAQSGDYCYMFAQENNITTDQLYAWNPILGSNGENCSTQFQAGYGYCVSVSS
ncbi:hypothetical protein F4859DRAFT_517504 [Xylaria cf. heliscus]|nr:hypothetical protein F4859DRAFT_517504 [Xylaria cf. heliscus]